MKSLFFTASKKPLISIPWPNRDYCIDYSVDQLEAMLDPGSCFRINRKYIVSIKACTQILTWSNSRLKLKIDGLDDEDIVVARERVQDFKSWLDQ